MIQHGGQVLDGTVLTGNQGTKPELCSVQGFVALTDQNDTVGLLRIGAYISMTPATFVRNRTLDHFRKKR